MTHLLVACDSCMRYVNGTMHLACVTCEDVRFCLECVQHRRHDMNRFFHNDTHLYVAMDGRTRQDHLASDIIAHSRKTSLSLAQTNNPHNCESDCESTTIQPPGGLKIMDILGLSNESSSSPPTTATNIVTHSNTSESQYPGPPKKPVIYLYDTNERDYQISLHVKLGKLTVLYPIPRPVSSSSVRWHIKSSSNGLMNVQSATFDSSRNHGYLFYEGQQMIPRKWEHGKGVVVNSEDLCLFLEQSAISQQLVDREVTDFVSYWLPIMQEHPQVYVEFNAQLIEDAVDLTITPPVDQVIRVFMVWSSNVEHRQNITRWLPTTSECSSNSQRHSSKSTVVEWGGVQMDL